MIGGAGTKDDPEKINNINNRIGESENPFSVTGQ